MDRIARDRSHRAVINDGSGQLFEVPVGDPSVSDLFRRLTTDASLLVRQEISLARAELRESAERLKEALRAIAIAAVLAIPGALALTAFLIIALGDAIGSYWASALMVGAVLIGTAAVLGRRAAGRAKESTKGMQRTADSLREDARWGKEELRTFKRELTA